MAAGLLSRPDPSLLDFRALPGSWSPAATLPVTTAPAARPLPGRRARRDWVTPVAGLPAIPLAVTVLLLLLAFLLAPERPWDQEAICHRHAGVEACRVW